MSFGSRLRELRKAKGWSRFQLADRMNFLLSVDGIKALELSPDREPQNGTRANLIKIFPELGTNTQPIEPKGYKYHIALSQTLVMRAAQP